MLNPNTKHLPNTSHVENGYSENH